QAFSESLDGGPHLIPLTIALAPWKGISCGPPSGDSENAWSTFLLHGFNRHCLQDNECFSANTVIVEIHDVCPLRLSLLLTVSLSESCCVVHNMTLVAW